MSSVKAFWVLSGPSLPCGARAIGDEHQLGPAREGTMWLDVCVLGQHLPQMYRVSEAQELTAEGCVRLGLCEQCLGWGDAGETDAHEVLHAARRVDEVKHPCPGCGGSGRPAIRVSVNVVSGGLTGHVRPLPHVYVPPLEGADPDMLALFEIPDDMCLACGMPAGGKGPREEELHIKEG
jgi:hypothetical protein